MLGFNGENVPAGFTDHTLNHPTLTDRATGSDRLTGLAFRAIHDSSLPERRLNIGDLKVLEICPVPVVACDQVHSLVDCNDLVVRSHQCEGVSNLHLTHLISIWERLLYKTTYLPTGSLKEWDRAAILGADSVDGSTAIRHNMLDCIPRFYEHFRTQQRFVHYVDKEDLMACIGAAQYQDFGRQA